MNKISETGTQLVAVSYDSATALSKFAKKRKITYTLLSDPDSKVIKSYGILNKGARAFTKGVPHPGTFVVGKDGVVKAKIFLGGYRRRHSPGDLIEAINKSEKKSDSDNIK